MTVDWITLEVLRNRFDSIAEEMQQALIHSAFSSIVKEAFDGSTALMDAKGETIAQANSLPSHQGMMIPAARRLLTEFPPGTMHDGDAYILNDPFDGGTHLPDIMVMAPVVYEGEVVMLACSMAHHQDIGGKVPGSCPTDSTDIYQEGLIIPPLKFYDRGIPNETFLKMFRRNSRIPDIVIGDLRAQLACGQVARGRVRTVMAEYGRDTVFRAMAELLNRAETMTRAAILAIPDGTYRFHDYLDNDGIDLDTRIRIEAAVTIRGSDLIVDFTGTSGQVKGPINCVESPTLAAVYFVVRAITDPAIPNNSGCYRPITVTMPKGSIVNCEPPAAVNARTVTFKRIADVLLGALVQAVPDRIPAASSGNLNPIYFGGIDPPTGKFYVSCLFLVGGMGARPNKDGIDAIDTDMTNTMNSPIESVEADFPLRVRRRRLREHSGGPGKYRGGLGVEEVIEVLRGEVVLSHRGERHFTPPWGLFGGRPALPWRSVVIRRNGERFDVPSKMVMTLREGDQLHMFTAGGAGYGDPLDRDPASVLEDVAGRKVSAETAVSVYGVIVDPVQRCVDGAATKATRERLRRERGDITWQFDRGEDLGVE